MSVIDTILWDIVLVTYARLMIFSGTTTVLGFPPTIKTTHDIAKILALKPSNLTLFYQYFVFNLQSVPITTV